MSRASADDGPLGVVAPRALAPQGNPEPAALNATSIPLTYHGGSVMRTNKTYAIYWVPSGYSVSTNYE
ncbi:MAG: hypothetical protein JO017_00190, partial [Actinobacteria bacterium]|nr:hypothetical protein [Actinomycetota bacterium]